MSKTYAGIGSRETPIAICQKMTLIATRLETCGYTLRSGAAQGADQAFANGCTNKQIFVPWDGFNGFPLIYPIKPEAYAIAKQHHPGWDYLKPGAQTLMARNAMQIMGDDLNTPSDFVVCWTPDGCISKKERSNKTGGTGQAISHAESMSIPVFNLAKNEHYLRFHQFLGKLKINF